MLSRDSKVFSNVLRLDSFRVLFKIFRLSQKKAGQQLQNEKKIIFALLLLYRNKAVEIK
jgi:hypothetical protein